MQVKCDSIEGVTRSRYGAVLEVELRNIDIGELVEALSSERLLGDLLDAIGEEKCISHFGIVVAEDDE